MRRFTHSIMACLIGAVSQTTLAGNEEGFYVGASYGESSFDLPFDQNGESEASSYKIFSGYNFNLIPILDLAIEGSYVDFGEFSDEFDVNTTIDNETVVMDGYLTTSTTGWDVFGIAGVSLGPVSLFGKLGMVSWKSEGKMRIPYLDNTVTNYSESGSDPACGLGVKVQFSSLSVRAEYEALNTEQFSKFDMLSIGVSYSF